MALSLKKKPISSSAYYASLESMEGLEEIAPQPVPSWFERVPKAKLLVAIYPGVLVAATIALALPAVAAAKDRDHDHMPDRWEAKYGLNTHKNDARGDKDRDGLRNLAEYRAHTNPRKADTDGDGIEDGAEHAGKVASFTGGVLTIDLFGGNKYWSEISTTEPNAPIARENASPAPDSNAGVSAGKTIVMKIVQLFAPRDAAACSAS